MADEKVKNQEDKKSSENQSVEAKAVETKESAQKENLQENKNPANSSAGEKAKTPENKRFQKGNKPYDKSGKGKGRNRGDSQEDNGPEMVEQVISINRITKVTKGGKKLSFSALVVVGDTKGNVGYSLSKAAEVAIAIRKAMGIAKKNMIAVPMKGTTITHEIIGQCSGSRVLLKPASDGTGVIASGPVRAVCDGAGIHNILTKVHRSNNPINVVKATIDGLSRLKKISSAVVEEAKDSTEEDKANGPDTVDSTEKKSE